jgi:hypothetical protein
MYVGASPSPFHLIAEVWPQLTTQLKESLLVQLLKKKSEKNAKKLIFCTFLSSPKIKLKDLSQFNDYITKAATELLESSTENIRQSSNGTEKMSKCTNFKNYLTHAKLRYS